MIAKQLAPDFVTICREIAHEAIDAMTEPEEILSVAGYNLTELMHAIADGTFDVDADAEPVIRH